MIQDSRFLEAKAEISRGKVLDNGLDQVNGFVSADTHIQRTLVGGGQCAQIGPRSLQKCSRSLYHLNAGTWVDLNFEQLRFFVLKE